MSVLKRRRKKRTPKTGELYQILQGKQVLVEQVYPSDGAALNAAQILAAKLSLGKAVERPIEYFVRLKPVLGPPDDLYHLVLRPDGVLLSYPAGALR